MCWWQMLEVYYSQIFQQLISFGITVVIFYHNQCLKIGPSESGSNVRPTAALE